MALNKHSLNKYSFDPDEPPTTRTGQAGPAPDEEAVDYAAVDYATEVGAVHAWESGGLDSEPVFDTSSSTDFTSVLGSRDSRQPSVGAQIEGRLESGKQEPGSGGLRNLGLGNSGQNPMIRPPVLVECPTCATKFTVSRAAISASDTPAFHCSKCDAVFSKPAAELVEVALKPQTPSTPTAFRPLMQPAASRSGLISDRAALNPIAPRSSREISERQLPLSFNSDGDVGDIGYVGDGRTIHGDLAHGNAARQQSEFTARSVTLKDLGEIHSTPLKDNSGEDQFGADKFSTSNRPETESGFSFRKFSDRVSTTSFTSIPELSRNVARKVPIVALAAPIFLCLLVLAITSWLSIIVPSLGGWMSDTFVSRTEAHLGRGLVLRGVSYSKITLENGTQMGIIAGSVYNGSGASIERATIEGIVFGRRGEELARVKSSLGNKLNSAKLSTLTAEMIQDLQSERRSRNISVRPGEGQPFVLAMALQPGARSFSARILNAR